jgi:hypothetical protein
VLIDTIKRIIDTTYGMPPLPVIEPQRLPSPHSDQSTMSPAMAPVDWEASAGFDRYPYLPKSPGGSDPEDTQPAVHFVNAVLHTPAQHASKPCPNPYCECGPGECKQAGFHHPSEPGPGYVDQGRDI